MRLRLLARRVLLACYLTSLTGCIEYRFDHFGEQDRYIGWVTTQPNLDPKLGSKGKLYLLPPSRRINPYIGGHFSRRRLTMNAGVIYYWSKRASLEFGIRSLVWETDNTRYGDDVGTIDFHDNDDDQVFYFGGKINF